MVNHLFWHKILLAVILLFRCLPEDMMIAWAAANLAEVA